MGSLNLVWVGLGIWTWNIFPVENKCFIFWHGGVKMQSKVNKPIFWSSMPKGCPGSGVNVKDLNWLTHYVERHSARAFLEQQMKLCTSYCEAIKGQKNKSLVFCRTHSELSCPNGSLACLSLTEKNALVRRNMFAQPVMSKGIIPIPWEVGKNTFVMPFLVPSQFPWSIKTCQTTSLFTLKGLFTSMDQLMNFQLITFRKLFITTINIALKGPIMSSLLMALGAVFCYK